MDPAGFSAHPTYIPPEVSLVELKARFPNPIDLRAALRLTPNGEIYRKIQVRDLTNFRQFREAYNFAKELQDITERDKILLDLTEPLISLDAFDTLEDLFQTLSPEKRLTAYFCAGFLYIEQLNHDRFLNLLFRISNIELNQLLIEQAFRKLPNPLNVQILEKIILTYLMDDREEYAHYLITSICPMLIPAVSVEDLLFQAGTELISRNRLNKLHLIINALVVRKNELIDRAVILLLEQDRVGDAVEIAKKLGDSEYILYLIGNKLREHSRYAQIHLVLNAMNARRNELLNEITIPLIEQGFTYAAYAIVDQLPDSAALRPYIEQCIRQKSAP